MRLGRATRGMVVSGQFPAKSRVRIGANSTFRKFSRQDEDSNSIFQKFPAKFKTFSPKTRVRIQLFKTFPPQDHGHVEETAAGSVVACRPHGEYVKEYESTTVCVGSGKRWKITLNRYVI